MIHRHSFLNPIVIYIYCCRFEGLLSMGWQQMGNMGWEKSSKCWRMSLSSPWHYLAVLVWKILLEAMWGQSMKNSIQCLLRYKFLGLSLTNPLTKIPIQIYKLFWAHINIPYILPANISHISLINYFGPSHEYYPLYPIYYSTWVFTSYHCQNYATKLYYLHKKNPNSFILWAKSKKPNKTL